MIHKVGDPVLVRNCNGQNYEDVLLHNKVRIVKEIIDNNWLLVDGDPPADIPDVSEDTMCFRGRSDWDVTSCKDAIIQLQRIYDMIPKRIKELQQAIEEGKVKE